LIKFRQEYIWKRSWPRPSEYFMFTPFPNWSIKH